MFEQFISELLYTYDSVILPGFGAFVLKYIPASIHPVENKMTPPLKIVSFEPGINQNDGILANHISEKKKISFIEANKEILHFVEGLGRTLSEGRTVTLQKLGSFSAESDGTILFSPDLSVNYNLETSGMEEISFRPVLRDDIQERLHKQFSENARIPGEKKRFSRAAIWIFVAAVVIAGTALALYFIQPDFIFRPSATAEKTVVSEKQGSQKVVGKNINTPSGDTLKKDTLSASEDLSSPASDKKYYVISGSFRVKENAENYLETLKKQAYHPNVILLQDKGMYAVSYDSYAAAADAEAELSRIRKSENSAAWILYH
jgi:nucleoid DNA-binding protein